MFPMHEINPSGGTLPVIERPPDFVMDEEEYEFGGHISDGELYSLNGGGGEMMVKKQQEINSQEARREALVHLERARTKPVAFAIRSNVNYDPTSDHHSPLHSFAIAFQARDCLHIKEKYNDDWWIGRLVKAGADVGFIPSPMKLESLRLQHSALNGISEDLNHVMNQQDTTTGGGIFSALNGINNNNNNNNKDKRTSKLLAKGKFQHPAPYDVVPSIRPVILIGPSLKGFEVTDMMQKAIFNFLKEHFENRIIITRVTADISLAKQLIDQTNPANGSGGGVGGVGGKRQGLMDRSSARMLMHMSEVTYEIERIFELARTMQLVVLDCDTINHPAQMAKTSLAPILVYLKVASPKVLQRLIKSRGRGQARQIDGQMNAAEKLIQLPSDAFDVVLDENQLEEACDHLAEFLENYWKAVHLPDHSEFLDMLEQEIKALQQQQQQQPSQQQDNMMTINNQLSPSHAQPPRQHVENYAQDPDPNQNHYNNNNYHQQSVIPPMQYQNQQHFYTNLNNQAPILEHNNFNNNLNYNYGP